MSIIVEIIEDEEKIPEEQVELIESQEVIKDEAVVKVQVEFPDARLGFTCYTTNITSKIIFILSSNPISHQHAFMPLPLLPVKWLGYTEVCISVHHSLTLSFCQCIVCLCVVR
jgi:hypothetical protein